MLVENFGFSGKSVSSDSIRACSHKVLSPPISHATSLLARPTQTPVRRAARRRARAGLGSIRLRARARGRRLLPRRAPLPCSHRHAIKKWLVSSTNRRKGEAKQEVFCSSDERERGGHVASPTRARKRATKRCSRSVGIELILPKTQENRCWRRAWGSGRTQREETTVRRSDLIFPRGANQMGNRRKRGAFGWR